MFEHRWAGKQELYLRSCFLIWCIWGQLVENLADEMCKAGSQKGYVFMLVTSRFSIPWQSLGCAEEHASEGFYPQSSWTGTPFLPPILVKEKNAPGDTTLLALLVFLIVIQKKKISDRNCAYSQTPWPYPGGMLTEYELIEDLPITSAEKKQQLFFSLLPDYMRACVCTCMHMPRNIDTHIHV